MVKNRYLRFEPQPNAIACGDQLNHKLMLDTWLAMAGREGAL